MTEQEMHELVSRLHDMAEGRATLAHSGPILNQAAAAIHDLWHENESRK